MSEQSELLTEKEAAKLLSLNPGTLRSWRCEGRGPSYVRLGTRAIRYSLTAIQEWVQRGQVRVED